MSFQEQLLAELRVAFGQAERRPDAELFAERDDYLWSEGIRGGSGPWWEVPPETIAHEPYALDQLTISGFQFFLPAYLMWVIQNTHTDYFTVDSTIYALDLTDSTEAALGDRSVRFDSLSSAQHAVVVKFLSWAAAHDELLDAKAASRALKGYWLCTKGDA
jgi:hypothetical protein